MTTLSDAIELTRQYLMTGQQDRINVLQTTVDASIETVQFEHEAKGLVPNARFAIELEEFHTIAASGTAPGSTATVIRGFGGSTAAAHTAGAIIRIAPQFSDWRIAQEINQELQDLSAPNAGLFRMRNYEFTFSPARAGYDIPVTDMIDVWRVNYDSPGPLHDWPVFNRRDWFLDQSASTSDFSSGNQLVLRQAASPGRTVKVAYKAKFGGPLTALSDNILTVTGLHVEAHQLLSLGAAISLAMGRDIKRSFMESQPEPRRSSEVGTSAGQIAMRPIISMYQSQLVSEVTRLQQRFPEQI